MRDARALLGLLVLPHEWAHKLALAPWAEKLQIELAPPADVSGVALARLSGGLEPGVPPNAVRFGALAPMVLYGTLVGLLSLWGGLGGLALPVGLALAFWAAPSAGDLAIARDPSVVVATGRLDAAGTVSAQLHGLSAAATGGIAVLFVTVLV